MPQFKVPEMHCGGCIAAVTKAIHAVDPQASVAADLATHVVAVQSAAAPAALAAAIDDAGFTVTATQ